MMSYFTTTTHKRQTLIADFKLSLLSSRLIVEALNPLRSAVKNHSHSSSRLQICTRSWSGWSFGTKFSSALDGAKKQGHRKLRSFSLPSLTCRRRIGRISQALCLAAMQNRSLTPLLPTLAHTSISRISCSPTHCDSSLTQGLATFQPSLRIPTSKWLH